MQITYLQGLNHLNGINMAVDNSKLFYPTIKSALHNLTIFPSLRLSVHTEPCN